MKQECESKTFDRDTGDQNTMANTQAIVILKLRSNAVPGGLLIPQTPVDADDAAALGMSPTSALNERSTITLLSGHTVPLNHVWSTRWGKRLPYVELETVEQETDRVWEGWKSFVPANRATSGHAWELRHGYLIEDFKDERVLDMAARGAALPAVAAYPFEDKYGRQNIDIHAVWRRITYDLDGFIDEMTSLVPPPLPTIPSSDVEEILNHIAFTYHQDIPSLVWTITHELGRIPVVQVCNETLRVIPDDQYVVQHVNENQLTITWGVERIGLVRLV